MKKKRLTKYCLGNIVVCNSPQQYIEGNIWCINLAYSKTSYIQFKSNLLVIRRLIVVSQYWFVPGISKNAKWYTWQDYVNSFLKWNNFLPYWTHFPVYWVTSVVLFLDGNHSFTALNLAEGQTQISINMSNRPNDMSIMSSYSGSSGCQAKNYVSSSVKMRIVLKMSCKLYYFYFCSIHLNSYFACKFLYNPPLSLTHIVCTKAYRPSMDCHGVGTGN